MDPVPALVGVLAIGQGLLVFFRPQLAFELRHFLSVTPESELSDLGGRFYRIGGVVTILVGLWLVFGLGLGA